ncbi:MAG: M23 family peptidase, partial [Alphaproteobacteria bacterium]
MHIKYMQFISYIIILTGLFITTLIYPQSTRTDPQNVNFISPLDIPLFLSSNYGEYRTGHFHAGVDFKTQQIEGKNVFAVDSGYVYRIAVLAGGYGNALYLKHPSGHITLY